MVTSPAVVRAAIRLVPAIPLPIARGLAVVAGWIAWLAMSGRRQALMKSLHYTAGTRSASERRRIARRTFVNMAGCAIDMFRMPTITPADLVALFEVHGEEHLKEAQAMGKGVIIVSGHIGPYELAAGFVASIGYKVHAMVENLSPEVYESLAAYRTSTGMGIVNMRDGIREAYKILARGELLILVADRAIGPAKSAIEVPFAGGRRRLPTGPATFAMGTGAPILVGFVSRNRSGRTRYRIDFDPIIVPEGRDNAERERLTRLISERIGRHVCDHPDEWFVFQPHWLPDAA